MGTIHSIQSDQPPFPPQCSALARRRGVRVTPPPSGGGKHERAPNEPEVIPPPPPNSGPGACGGQSPDSGPTLPGRSDRPSSSPPPHSAFFLTKRSNQGPNSGSTPPGGVEFAFQIYGQVAHCLGGLGSNVEHSVGLNVFLECRTTLLRGRQSTLD